VSIKLREDLASTLILVAGESYRVGQIGAFLRVPLGYTQLYGVCTQIGAAAIPENARVSDESARRWLTITLFGEAVGKQFERGVSQYPTVGDEVHLVTNTDLTIIYGSLKTTAQICVGNLAASSGIAGNLDLAKLISKHCAIVGSTGAGKSNFVAVMLNAIAKQGFPNARVVIIDPHGEYGSSLCSEAEVYKLNADSNKKEHFLEIPFWALPFNELKDILLGGMQQGNETLIRDRVLEMKKNVSKHINPEPPESEISSDSPIPFDIYELWYELDCRERQTYQDNLKTIPTTPLTQGNARELRSNTYPAHAAGNVAPFAPNPKGIQKNLELMRSRLKDENYQFLFNLKSNYMITTDGKPNHDIDKLVASWVGHSKPITILDVSGVPSEITSTIVGTLLRIIYDTLFWAGDLPVSGRNQPLLIVLEEAHLFLPEGQDSSAHRIVGKIAKEGRKYGVGLAIVTQRPQEIDSTSMSQCGTMIALRLTNDRDRSVVSATMPDQLGDLSSMLPSLRTGEGLVIGEAMPIPSRIQFKQAQNKPIGDNPDLITAWCQSNRPDIRNYATALKNWRARSFK
jgi:hypothetical protein